MTARRPFDAARYARKVGEGPCFICEMLAGEEASAHHLVYGDEHSVAFLNRYPTLRGATLVAPRRHAESWVRDLTGAEFLALQQVIRTVAAAVEEVLAVERMYVLSLGSQQGNAHVHWHLAPLPPGVPYEHQQYHALMAEHGVLDVTDAEQAELAAQIARAVGRIEDAGGRPAR